MEVSLSLIIAQIIAYLTYIGIIAGAVSVGLDQLKPLFLTQVKDYLANQGRDNLYVILIYAVRFVITVVAYNSSVESEAIRSFFPNAEMLSDQFFMAVTILLIVLGEELIHRLMEWAGQLGIVFEAVEGIELPYPDELTPVGATGYGDEQSSEPRNSGGPLG